MHGPKCISYQYNLPNVCFSFYVQMVQSVTFLVRKDRKAHLQNKYKIVKVLNTKL